MTYPRRHLRLLFSSWLVGVLALAGAAAAQPSDGFDEYRVKAALVFKLAKFIEWPDAALGGPRERLAFCVLGRSPMAAALDRTLAGKTVGGRRIEVRRSKKVEDLESCQVVFIAGSEARDDSGNLAALAGSPILSVGETECFASRGGMINLVVESEQIRFEINPGRLEQAGLRVSPNVLSLAKIVGPEEECNEDVPPAQ